ncbi:MAG: hypothetical protein AMS22_09585 [Thiotrichales bacterium SG8_50]|jgi:hypothetical protein|nr:MAG: hypothetical protein AMS22_09585 [Thiotrichales bacterium SG8_50]
MSRWGLLAAALVAFGIFNWWTARPLLHGPGVVAGQAPIQEPASGARPFQHAGYQLTPLARFEVEARVLGKEPYRLGREAELAPVDLALGWGRMSDERVLKHLSIRQTNRFYIWSASVLPIPEQEIIVSSANMHLIPANKSIGDAIGRVRVGQIARVGGYLVRVDSRDGWYWTSSLTRTDSGAGACELVWVERFSAR